MHALGCRLTLDGSAAAWYTYAMFLARNNTLSKCEEALRRAVSSSDDHADAAVALACVLWHNGKHTDGVLLKDAQTVRHCSALPCLVCLLARAQLQLFHVNPFVLLNSADMTNGGIRMLS